MVLLCTKKLKNIKLWILLTCFGIGVLIIWLLFYIRNEQCSDDYSRELLQITCELYRNGFIIGSLCPLMCDDFKVKFDRCTNYRSGKTVLIMSCDDACIPGGITSAILKSHFPDIEMFKDEMMGSDYMVSTTLVQFRNSIRDTIWSNLGINISQSEDVIQRIFQPEYDQYINPLTDQKYKAFVLTVWSLVQQDEYLLTKLHQNSPLFPQIYHSCGSLYLMESAPPGHILNSPRKLINSYTPPWHERVSVALKLLDTVLYMDSKFHQTLHMCDLKGENFGVGAGGEIKLIDADSVLFDYKLSTELTQEKTCSKNQDCSYWDCHGLCSNGVCSKERINNNLQSLIEDVFMPSLPVYNNGLLVNPPDSIKHELQDLFTQCVKPFPDKNKEKVSMEIYWKLYNLLKSTLL